MSAIQFLRRDIAKSRFITTKLFTCDKSTGLPIFARKRGRYRSPATIPFQRLDSSRCPSKSAKRIDSSGIDSWIRPSTTLHSTRKIKTNTRAHRDEGRKERKKQKRTHSDFIPFRQKERIKEEDNSDPCVHNLNDKEVSRRV
jgi:hypothetical protein